MKAAILLVLALAWCVTTSLAKDIATLDGHTYENVKDISLKHDGLFFVYGSVDSLHGVTV